MPECRRSDVLPIGQLGRIAAILLVFLGVFVSGCTVQINNVAGAGAGDVCTPNPCQLKGVCAGYTGTCTVDAKDKTKYSCATWKPLDPKNAVTAPLGYEVSETSCDGKDNDCDGLTDETFDGSKTSCPILGVCGGTAKPVAACIGGTLQCNFAVVAAYEASETTCDGKDNDCNGQTDEMTEAPYKTCSHAGVCAGAPAPICAAAADKPDEFKWECGFSALPDYEIAETKCDGKDNDCDGIVDANLAVTGLTCAAVGACSAGVAQVCKGGVPVCDYSKVDQYQIFETKCDGIDNDCDGATDNFAGSGQALLSADNASCLTAGVCGVGKNAIVKVCKAKQFICDYSAVPLHEVTETTCDGKDNDCDGIADNISVKPSPSPCGTQGVCSGGKVSCESGLWTCNYGALGAQGYEAFELTCDGKDNDCDGKVDETLDPAANKCKTTGACAYGTLVNCAAGKSSCDYSHVLGFQDVTETQCDGIDNNCDGKTDEPESLDSAKSGCAKGVCEGKVKVSCKVGKWDCDFSGVSKDEIKYEAKEASCDGFDNDCNGLTDEGLTDVIAAKCPNTGVCKSGVTAGCAGGKYVCNFDAITAHQAVESLCDGLDNDCDGKIDVGACAAGSPCTSNDQCASNTCVAVYGGTGNACANKANQCAFLTDDKKVTAVDDAGTTCASGIQILTCGKGKWSAAVSCPPNLPACVGGGCALCLANATTCDPADNTKVVQCAADGKSQNAVKSCGGGEHCAGAGACVPDALLAVSDTPAAGAAVGVKLGSGGFAVAWLTEKSVEVRVRIFQNDGTPKGPSIAVQKAFPATAGSRLAIANLGAGFALVWMTSSALETGDIVLRMFDGNGASIGNGSIINTTTADKQDQPAIGSNGTNAVVAWASDGVDSSGRGIVAIRIDATGAVIGSEIMVNVDASNAIDPTEDDDQVQPAVAVKPNGDFGVAWQHSGTGASKDRIRGRAFNADGLTLGNVQTLSATNVNNRLPTLAFGKSEFVVAWTAFSLDGAGSGVGLRHTDGVFKPSAAAGVAANTITNGDQDDTSITTLLDGSYALLWKSPGAVSPADGVEVDGRDIANTTGYVGGENILTKASSLGDQDQGRAIAFADGRILYLWRFKANANTPTVVQGLFR